MLQIVQNLKNGQTELLEVPTPRLAKNKIAVQTQCSLISAGTEKMLIDFGKGSYLQKARQQPDKVKMVLDKIRTDGVGPTLNAVFAKLNAPLPLGYCNVGVVDRIGAGVNTTLSPGDRVASNSYHAEVVCTTPNLCAAIPDTVSDEAASFTVIGAIALQGIRLAGPTLGEYFVVTGLGLVGLMTVQILRANGCSVLGIDFDSSKCELARSFGAQAVDLSKGEDPIAAAQAFTKGRGVDGALITASTKSNEPVHQGATMCRKRGRIVLVGVVGLELSRADFFEKELSFQVSCSYGPGRYDAEYEDKGNDYPMGYVRWTEQRNFEAVLDLMASGAIEVTPLISHRFDFVDAEKAYAIIGGNTEPYIGVVLNYGQGDADPRTTIALSDAPPSIAPGSPVVGMIGAGGYTGQVLLPAMKKCAGITLHTIASGAGVSGTHLGKKFGFGASTTDSGSIMDSPEINTVCITTRHNSHAGFVLQALEAGKHVFVEKPLCMSLKELEAIEAAVASRPEQLLMVGYNRRFAPQVQDMKKALDTRSGPLSLVMTVNAGAIPANHWTQDMEIGGGRLIGEACHFIDLLRFVCGRAISDFSIQSMDADIRDTFTINLRFEDGSMGTVHYFANGSKTFPKERLEVFSGGRVLQLDNFKTLKGFGWPKGSIKNRSLWNQDKGQKNEMQAFFAAIAQGGEAPISREELFEVMRVTIKLAAKLS